MAIKVLFSPNQNTITVGGLYQWDYGRVLEIECTELGSEIMEVHFACRGMEEAIVRPCTFSSGIGTVTIPDRCLEQTNDITAWIYKVESTQGHTVKTITLPVVARTRPSKSVDIPTEHIDRYAEALTQINEAVDRLEHGTITAAKATHSVSADGATTAASAATATHATYADRAGSATSADSINASGVKNTKVIEGEFDTDKIMSTENFIKPKTRYIVCFGGDYFTGYSNSLGDRIDFSGNTYIAEGKGSDGILWNGILATAGFIIYRAGQGVELEDLYMMFICDDGVTCMDYISNTDKGLAKRLTAIYECEAIEG